MRKIGIDINNKIKQLDVITDSNLTVLEFDETAIDYIFKDWSDFRILCYCYEQKTEHLYPWVSTDVFLEIEKNLIKKEVD
jgi:hypothetical protein